jgi:MFS family permease
MGIMGAIMPAAPMAEPAVTTSKNPIRRVFALRDFRLLFGGTATSILGDQFYLIATPWLVLQMTNDPLALGFVTALGGIPRAVLMLLGGAFVDRFSQRAVMIASDVLRMIFTGLLAVAVLTGTVQLWMLYLISLGFGLVAGFAVPAGNSIVPMLVEERDLQAGNSVILGSTQIAGFIGPTLAGILIGGLSKSMQGVGVAYAVDAASFLLSAAALLLMRTGKRGAIARPDAPNDGIMSSIFSGIKFLWQDPALRLMFVVVTAVNFLFIGPMLIGIPVLANQYLKEGAVAFGLLVSGVAGGNLIGYILAAQLPRPGGKVIRILLLAGLAVFGLAVGAMGFIRSTTMLFIIIFLLGLGNGYIVILVLTWIQSRTPRDMLGRMMSMLMLTNTGLSPVSQAASGAVMKVSFTGLFVLAGTGLLFVPLWIARQPGLKAISDGLAMDNNYAKELVNSDE